MNDALSNPLENLLSQSPKRVKIALNVLIETPYFYRADNEEIFFFLRRHREAFGQFFDQYFGWSFIIDDKCARVHKGKWYNTAVSESQRDIFGFRRRDECLAFLIILEFFEHQLDEHGMTVEDSDNPRFRLGDLLTFLTVRFGELFPEHAEERYTEEKIRKNILRSVIPALERYRFLEKLPPPKDMADDLTDSDLIYEALPALFHYNTQRLFRQLEETELSDAFTEEGDDNGN